MDKSYIKLFTEIVHTTEILAERVMELNHTQNDTKGEATAKTMRDDFSKLYDKMRDEKFDFNSLTKAEYAKLLVGTLIVVNNIEDRITGEKKALNGYKTGVIPKLQRIVDECKTDEEAITLAMELFKIDESNN